MARTPDYMPTTYTQAKRLAESGRGNVKKIGNNTTAEVLSAATVAVRYHATDIVLFTVDGEVILNSGGHRTVTTKARLHEVAQAHGWSLSQRSFTWYLTHRATGAEVEFFDMVNIASLNPAALNPA